ncbi:MAG: alanine dehydrogenase, partial [Rhodothermales bacterium]
MEIPALQGLKIEQGLMTLEHPLPLREQHKTLRIGVPREVSNEERRVALAPGGVTALVANGHEVYVETQAGTQAHFTDHEYAEAGAEIAASPEDLYSKCQLIVKVGPPSGDELDLLQEKQVVISALHLGVTTPAFLHRLMELGITGIGFEFMRDSDGTFPIVRMMHEIMGSLAVQIAARYLESDEGGKGVMLGGISGVPPSTVVILGAGVVGEWAARTALGFGAHVIVLDTDLGALRALEHYLDRRITTAMASNQYIRGAVASADVVIGAMMADGQRSPILITEDMVTEMRAGSVIVDAVIDQGGCVETSRATAHSNPTFRLHDVIHYCVPNMPSNAARTATYALNNVLVPYLIQIGEVGSINEALWRNVGLRNGAYVYRRHLTKKSLA